MGATGHSSRTIGGKMNLNSGFSNKKYGQILIVDDDEDTCKLLELFFKARGYTVISANSGREAVSYVESSALDAVILDIMMPEIDGLTTFTEIRRRSDVPILFLTAYESKDIAVQALRLGGNDFMRKPFYPGELLARIESLIRNHTAVHSSPEDQNRVSADRAGSPEVSIVIPAYNEEKGLPLVLRAVFGVLDDKYEVVVVDDGSSDQTAAVAEKFPCRLIRHQLNRGKGAALRTGLMNARGKKVIFLDADNTYPVSAIPTLAHCLDDNKLVRGIRMFDQLNMPLINRVGNNLFDTVIKFINLVEGGDMLSGMYGGQRDVLLGLHLEAEGFDIEAEICVKAKAQGFHCASVPITYAQRVGEKKLNAFHDGFRILYRIMQLAVSYSPLLTFIYPGLALIAIGLIGLFLEQFNQLYQSNLSLAMNSLFVIGAIESLGAQLLIFGTAIYEAGMAYGLRGQANKRIDKISHLLATRPSMLTGVAMAATGVFGLLWVSVGWLLDLGAFQKTGFMIFISYLLLIGIQIVSAGIFLSALKGLNRISLEPEKVMQAIQGTPIVEMGD